MFQPLDDRTSHIGHRYIAGAASSFSGEDIIKESGYGVVAVIIQYRLGVFGFLPGSEVLANGTLNAGLRKWRVSAVVFTAFPDTRRPAGS